MSHEIATYVRLTTVRKHVLALTFALAVHKSALVHGTVGPGKDTGTVALVLQKHTIVDAAIVPFVSTFAMALIKLVFTSIRITVGEGSTTISVPAAVAPVRCQTMRNNYRTSVSTQ